MQCSEKINFEFLTQNFASPYGAQSFLKGIPVSMEQIVRDLMKASGKKYRFRYRGPRSTGWYMLHGQPYYRGRDACQADCLKAEAKTFSVYLKG